MRSPVDQRFLKTQQVMKSGMAVGLDRPVGRVTFAKQTLRHVTAAKPGLGALRFLDDTAPEWELLTIRTIDIDRSIGQDAATCTITMYNSDAESSQPDGQTPDGEPIYGRAGYMTPGRGVAAPAFKSVYDHVDDFWHQDDAAYPTTWDFNQNRFRDVLVPNTVIRTYQGYGSDNLDVTGNFYDPTDDSYIAPPDDSQLYLTGVWLIDQASFSGDGSITLECRDLGKLLIEQYIYPPMIPVDRFPLIYCPAHKATGHKEQIGKNVATYHSASSDKHFGRNGKVSGHRGSDAFDTKLGSFWFSGPDGTASGVEWLQAKTHGEVNEVVLNTWGGNYIAYISVHENGRWQGTSTVTGSSENLTASEGNGGDGYLVHNVVHGDTLWDLALTFYGRHDLWPRIAKANNNIVKDPHWIYPGQHLKIPYIKGTKNPPPSGGSGTGGTKVTIPYVIRATVPKSGIITIRLPRMYKADYVRVVLTNLTPYQGKYRAGVRTFNVRSHITNTYHPGTIGKAGYIQDWTEPIKELCAWAGLTWVASAPTVADPVLGSTAPPATASALRTSISALKLALARGHLSTAEKRTINTKIAALQAQLNALLTTNPTRPLRVWGDFEILGAGPVVCTPGDYFMSKSFKEGIQQVADFIGGIFYIDEFGGAQFRLPNIWSTGNFIDDTDAGSALGARISSLPIEFHEDANLVQYEMTISDADLRSEVLVIGGYPGVNSKGPVAGGYVLGYNAATGTTSAIDFSSVLAGQYRLMVVPGDATKLFYTELECQRMAELTALFILFTYRQGSLRAPCNPALQIDDQVRIIERVTHERNVHYVSAMRTHQDLESGEYTMDVTTHWLGGDPNTNWFVNKAQLTPAVKSLPAILKRVGRQAGGDNFEQPPYGT